MKPGNPHLQSIRLFEQVRERIRYLHYSLGNDSLLDQWVRFFVRCHGSTARSGHKHPKAIAASIIRRKGDGTPLTVQAGKYRAVFLA